MSSCYDMLCNILEGLVERPDIDILWDPSLLVPEGI